MKRLLVFQRRLESYLWLSIKKFWIRYACVHFATFKWHNLPDTTNLDNFLPLEYLMGCRVAHLFFDKDTKIEDQKTIFAREEAFN